MNTKLKHSHLHGSKFWPTRSQNLSTCFSLCKANNSFMVFTLILDHFHNKRIKMERARIFLKWTQGPNRKHFGFSCRSARYKTQLMLLLFIVGVCYWYSKTPNQIPSGSNAIISLTNKLFWLETGNSSRGV